MQNQHQVDRLRIIARKHPHYGYRRAHAVVRRDLPAVNLKQTNRIWRDERLQVPHRRARKRRLDRRVCPPISAARPNQVWTYDFVHDTCANGQRLKILTVTDEFTRECLAIEVATRLQAREIIAVMERVVRERGTPTYLLSDKDQNSLHEQCSPG